MKIKLKRVKEARLHPALVFLILTFIVMIISSVGHFFQIEANYYTVNSVTGNIDSQVVTINSLFNRTGLQYLISNLLSNFTSFVPLGTLIVGLMGIGVAYKSGFLDTLFSMIAKKSPRKFITFLVVLLGVIFSIFYDVGYVILIPLAAILFLNLGRHPSAGICAAFAGITFGYGASIVANGLDATLMEYTESATKVLDSTYNISVNCNLYFMIASTLLIAYVGMIVTEKFIIPKLGKYNFSDEEKEVISREPTKKEKKGVLVSLLFLAVIVLVLIYCITPGLPFSGLLLYLKDDLYIEQLFGSNSYFYQGVVCIFSVLLMLAGLIYGLRVKTIKNNRDFVDGMNYYLKDLSSILVLIFFAAQFVLIFKQTNIGVFIVVSLSEVLSSMKITGFALVFIVFLVVMVSSIFVPTASTKWAILSPIVVPMFMQSSLTPEFAQAVFRAADSSVKGITPVFSYFVILIGFLQIYNKKKDDIVTITDAMSLMIPYTIAFSLLWLIIVICFYILGLPIGIGVSSVL